MFLNRITCHSASLRKAPKRRIRPLRPAAYVQSVENVFDSVPSIRTSKPSTCAIPSETKTLSASNRTASYDRNDGNHPGVRIMNILRCSGINVRDWKTSEMRSKYMAFFLSNAPTCPCGVRGPPSWAWQQCNRLLRLGRP